MAVVGPTVEKRVVAVLEREEEAVACGRAVVDRSGGVEEGSVGELAEACEVDREESALKIV